MAAINNVVTNYRKWQPMEIMVGSGASSTVDDEDSSSGEDAGALLFFSGLLGGGGGQKRPQQRRLLLRGCLVVIVAVVVAAVYYTHDTRELDAAASLEENEGKLLEHDGNTDTPEKNRNSKNGDIAGLRNAFPGMQDNTTHVDCCSAGVIVTLEHQFSNNLPMPFSLLLFDANTTECARLIGSIEVDTRESECCNLPPERCGNQECGGFTLPDWVKYCSSADDQQHEGENNSPTRTPSSTTKSNAMQHVGFFDLFYEACPTFLAWSPQSCHEQIKANDTIVRKKLPLVDGEFSGIVVVRETNVTSILVPDVFNSCWILWGGWDEETTTDEVIQFAQKSLRRVTLEHFVDTIKNVWCE